MKKTNFLKIALTLVLAFVMTGAFAQTYVQGNPINHTSDITDYEDVAEDIIQTVGYGITLYVAPDPVFSPTYDGTGARGTNLNASSLWRWVYDATAYDEGGTETEVKGWLNQNWVELTAAQVGPVGTRTFYVKEKTTCEAADATAQSINVNVIAAPTATMVGANTSTNWQSINGSIEWRYCGEGVTDNLTLAFTEVGAIAAEYVWEITATAIRYNAAGQPVNAAGAVIADPAGATALADIETVADITTITRGDFVAGTPGWSAVTPTMNYLETSGGVDLRTKYVFTFTNISSTTLALSQTRAGVPTAYVAPGGTQTVTYWLNLPPVTGPIYHIPNNFNF